MQKWGKGLFCVVFSFIFVFISVGYAKLADTVYINGFASITSVVGQNSVIITKITPIGGTAEPISSNPVPGTTTAKIEMNGTAEQYTTYEITFENFSTNVTYVFNKVVCTDASLEDNAYFNNGLTISTTLTDGTTSVQGVSIAPGTELKIHAKYLLGSGIPQNLYTILKYEFLVHVNSAGNYAAEKSLARFAEILNSKDTYTAEEASALLGENITKPMTKMEILTEVMSTQGGGWGGTGYYVGNVVGSGDLHSKVLNDLFEEDLKLDLYDPATNTIKETGMTCMIKEQDVCGSNIKEMILYMTAEELNGKCNTTGWFTGYYENRYVTVYAAVFTLVNSEWIQLGDIYDGQANPNNYSGGGRNSDANSFRTDSWVSTAKTYDVSTAVAGPNGNLVNAYSYTVAAGQDISEIMEVNDATANQVFTDLLKVSDDILNGVYGSFAGSAVTALTELKAEIVSYMGSSLVKNANGTYTISGRYRSELVPYMQHLRALITPFEEALASEP